jgi:hypothetical protein
MPLLILILRQELREKDNLLKTNGQNDQFILVNTETETATETVSSQAVVSVPNDTSDSFKV